MNQFTARVATEGISNIIGCCELYVPLFSISIFHFMAMILVYRSEIDILIR